MAKLSREKHTSNRPFGPFDGKSSAKKSPRHPPSLGLPPVSPSTAGYAGERKKPTTSPNSSSTSAKPPNGQRPIRAALRRIWRWTRNIIILLLVLVVVGLGVLYQQTHAVAKAIVVPEVRPNPSIATPLVGGVTMLIIGVDERPDHPEEGVRSDTLIVAHLDGTGRWVNLLSIPRDTQVDLLDVGLTKINVAYGQGYARAEELYGEGTLPQQGGMALAAQTVEQFFETAGSKVNIDYTAQINFDGFVGVIDALDGVTIDVPKLIVDDYYPTENYGTMQVEFQPGVQQMDGETALIYARTRHADSDFHRSSRQQQVMRAIVAKLQEKGWFGRIVAVPKLLSGIKGENGEGEEGGENASTPPILTTMPIDRLDMLAGLLSLASGLESDSIGQLRLSPETVPVTEVGSNLIWESAGVQSLARQLKVPPEPEESTEESANEE